MARLIISCCFALKESWKSGLTDWLQQPWQSSREDKNRLQTSQVGCKQKISQGAEAGCKVLNSPAPSDVVILVIFLSGEDLINAEKQTRCARWRSYCGARTVAQDTSSCRKETELCVYVCACVGGSNRSHGRFSLTPPWTPDLTFRRLLITSAWHLAH